MTIRLLLAAFLLLSISLSSACGGRHGRLAIHELQTPVETDVVMDTRDAFLNVTGRLNSYVRYRNGREDGATSRTLTQVSEIPARWRSWDSRGNWIDFQWAPGTGLLLNKAHNTQYGSWIEFEPKLNFAPETMEQNVPHIERVQVTTWADGWTTMTARLDLQTTFIGIETISSGMGDIAGCIRLDSQFDMNFPLGFTVALKQRQWLHPIYGEVMRDIEGTWGIIGVGLNSFSSRQIIESSASLEPERLESLFREIAEHKAEERRKREGRRGFFSRRRR